MSKFGILSILLIIISVTVEKTSSQVLKDLYPQYVWKYLDFQFPNAAERQKAINSGTFILGSAFPIDIDVHYGGFVQIN